MTNRHSVCSLVRFAINSPGKTVHSGRGYYTMRHGLSATELMNKLTGVAKWAWQKQGILESDAYLIRGLQLSPSNRKQLLTARIGLCTCMTTT